MKMRMTIGPWPLVSEPNDVIGLAGVKPTFASFQSAALKQEVPHLFHSPILSAVKQEQ